MNIFMTAALLALIPIGAVLIYLLRTLSARQDTSFSLEESLVLPVTKYQPMEKLLRRDDFEFLAGQPGYSASLGRRFRTERRRVFRGYLRCLRRDFGRVSLTFHTLIVHSAEDRGDLAAALVRERLKFGFGLLAIECRLLLHAAGVDGLNVDVRGMVESVETMQAQMRTLLSPPQASMAAF